MGPRRCSADCLDAVLDDLIDGLTGAAPTQVRGAAAYAGLLARLRPQVTAAFTEVVVQVAALLTQAQEVRSQLSGLSSLVLLPALTDVQGQLAELLPDGFVSRAGVGRLADLSTIPAGDPGPARPAARPAAPG